MKAFPVIEITAETPFERGVEYGSQAKGLIDACVRYYRTLFLRDLQTWEQVQEYALGYVPIVEKAMPEAMEEARGIAQGSGKCIGEIMAVNCRYEITKFPFVPECTTAAILPEASLYGKTYAVKNWDYNESIFPHIVLLHIKTKAYSALGWAEAGQLIREGFNSYGIAICNNSLMSAKDYPGHGVPVTFLRRRVLASKAFEEARDIIVEAPRCVSNNILLVGAKGQVANFEAQPDRIDYVPSRGGILAHANHFVIDEDAEAHKDRPRNRDARLRELLDKRRGCITVDYIAECLRDHAHYPLSICGHPARKPDDAYGNERMTVASMIVDFAENTAHICAGPPCEGEFLAYTLEAGAKTP
jgi:isopenicillin-N N-acyltransferase-like protein